MESHETRKVKRVTHTGSGRSIPVREHMQRPHSRKEPVFEELKEGPLGKGVGGAYKRQDCWQTRICAV